MRHIALWPVILLNIILLNSESAFAATQLKGQVTLRDKNGEPVNNAQISAIIGKANPTDTNSDGVFVLEFLDKQPKEIVRFNCTFSVYDVVNKLDLEQKLPADPNDHVVQIVMCPSETFFPCATAYYEKLFGEIIEYNRQQEREKIEQEYNEELQNAEERLKDKDELVRTQQELLNAKNARIAKLEGQNKGLQSELAKQYAEYDPATDDSEEYKQGLKLFQEKRFEELKALLAPEKIEKKRQLRIKQAQEMIKQANAEAAKEYILLARTGVFEFDFANAEKYYQMAKEADPENFNNLHEFALYLQKQNQFLTARPLYEKALTFMNDDSDIAATLNNLGALYSDVNDYDKAAYAYERALVIYEELAAANPQTYRPDVARTLNNFGVLYKDLNQYDKAADAYDRALAIYEDLAAANPTAYRPYAAGTLNNLGNLYSDQNDYARAADAYDRALNIREELAAANPTAYRSDVARTLNNLGVLYWNQNDYAKAADAYERALNIREELAAANPTAYRPDVAMTLNNLGILYRNQNDYDKADAYDRALEIYEELAAANPQAYELDLCMTLTNLSYLYQTLYEREPQSEHKTEGLALAERAIGILQKYPNIPRAQDLLRKANARKAFFEQAGE